MYLHGRGKISNVMNRVLHEFLDLTPTIILSSLLQSKYHFSVGGITPKYYSMFHYDMEIGKINWFEGISTADMRHRSNCIISSA
jgi:hypothetical protein